MSEVLLLYRPPCYSSAWCLGMVVPQYFVEKAKSEVETFFTPSA